MPEEFRDSVDAGAGNAIDNAVDIGAVASAAPEPERKPGKRRGRPPGSTNSGSGKSAGAGKEKARHSLDLSSLTGLFVGIHVVGATALNVPELAIDMKEGDDFMKSAQNVMRHYSVESSQKTIDWLAFGGTCCMIYGTRFGAYMLRKRTEAQEQVRPGGTVYQMPQRAAPSPQTPQTQPAQEVHIAPEMEYESE